MTKCLSGVGWGWSRSKVLVVNLRVLGSLLEILSANMNGDVVSFLKVN